MDNPWLMAEATFSHPDNDRLTVSETSKERAITFDLGIFWLNQQKSNPLTVFWGQTTATKCYC
jgi:hypothetical protein